MRLLEIRETGGFRLTNDLIGDIPPYAILSHTWGRDDEEVTFKELVEGIGQGKVGYKKIELCGQQAARDGLQYFWVDTCCIDKSNNTELSEAINSMFRWYRKAAKCYVYLVDVLTSNTGWESAFRRSRWFSRGWTLQELIAPISVEFFSLDWKKLGSRSSLERHIHESTGISAEALQGKPLSDFSIEERMSWAKQRQTKREEDWAYSLLGIFNVHMPLIYGEGKENAIIRLQAEVDRRLTSNSIIDTILRRLPNAEDAPFNSYSKQLESDCLPETRVDLLRDIYDWADSQDRRNIFWLNGLAGTGKSTISRTIARKYYEKDCLGASFFFSRGGGDVSIATKFVTSIAVQMARNIPTLSQYILESTTQRSDITSQSLRDQWHQLVLGPLSKLDGNNYQSYYVIVVDALDECDDENGIKIIIRLLAEARSLKAVRLRVFLTSRPEIPIRSGFYQIPDTDHQDFVLQNISPSIVDHDIAVYLEHNLWLVARERSLGDNWPGTEVIRTLVRSANGLFIWAATACRFIREGKRFANRRLRTILDDSSTVTAPEKYLNEIYLTILRHSISSDYTTEEKEELYSSLKQILGSLVVLLSPLSFTSLCNLLDMAKEDVEQTLEDLHAILDIPRDQQLPLRLHHPSFRDFLLNRDRCTDVKFWVDEKQIHQVLAESCIQLLSKSLRKDIFGVRTPGKRVVDMENDQIQRYLPLEIQYSCLYWIQHVKRSDSELTDDGQVHQFLKGHLLHWLEALGWMQKLSEGIQAIIVLEMMIDSTISPQLYQFIQDTRRFVLNGRQAIEEAPLQVYCSALVFAPEMSIIKTQFSYLIPSWMDNLSPAKKNWSALLQTLEGHSGYVFTVVFSPDSKMLASVSIDSTVRLWDTSTGAVLQTLTDTSEFINTVVFSPNGQTLLSASRDQTVKLWDTSTGSELKTYSTGSGQVTCMAFSSDGRMLASALEDSIINLWSFEKGAILHKFEGDPEGVISLAFSPNSKILASGAYKLVKLWDTNTGSILHTLDGHWHWVKSMAFSPNGKVLASGSDDFSVILWDTYTGEALLTLRGFSYRIHSLAFNPHEPPFPGGEYLATASHRTIKVWSTKTGEVLQTFEGHLDWILCTTFSPDGWKLASASEDTTVRLWGLAELDQQQKPEAHARRVRDVALSPDHKMIASASYEKTVKIWDVDTGQVLLTLDDHSDWAKSILFSPNSKMLAVASDDSKIKLWDTRAIATPQLLGDFPPCTCMDFSSDSNVLALALEDHSIRLWDTNSATIIHNLNGHSHWVTSLAFSPDAKVLVSVSIEPTVKLWNTITGTVIHTLDVKAQTTIAGDIRSPHFFSDGKWLIILTYDQKAMLWDTIEGTLLRIIEPEAEQISPSAHPSEVTYHSTGSGTCYMTSSSLTDASQVKIYAGLSIQKQWLRWGSEDILWLPPEYRPSAITYYGGDVIAIGQLDGRVSLLEFSF